MTQQTSRQRDAYIEKAGNTMNYRRLTPLAHCIGCGCHDFQACESGCWWLRVDYAAAVGVCSECGTHVERWDAGDRSAAVSSQLVGSVDGSACHA
jgi:uncharacterized protein (DUF983 family)